MTAPCKMRRHTWGKWQPVTIDVDHGSSYDTQRRFCGRCNRRQLRHWWNR